MPSFVRTTILAAAFSTALHNVALAETASPNALIRTQLQHDSHSDASDTDPGKLGVVACSLLIMLSIRQMLD